MSWNSCMLWAKCYQSTTGSPLEAEITPELSGSSGVSVVFCWFCWRVTGGLMAVCHPPSNRSNGAGWLTDTPQRFTAGPHSQSWHLRLPTLRLSSSSPPCGLLGSWQRLGVGWWSERVLGMWELSRYTKEKVMIWVWAHRATKRSLSGRRRW